MSDDADDAKWEARREAVLCQFIATRGNLSKNAFETAKLLSVIRSTIADECTLGLEDFPSLGEVIPPDARFADRALVSMAEVMSSRDLTPPKQVRCVLIGLSLNGRWRRYLDRGAQCDRSTYVLAHLVVYALELHGQARLEVQQMAQTTDILNAWAAPTGLPLWGSAVPSPLAACKVLFGSVWCDFHGIGNNGIVASALIRRDRPAFEPGIAPSDSVCDAWSLPVMDCAP